MGPLLAALSLAGHLLLERNHCIVLGSILLLKIIEQCCPILWPALEESVYRSSAQLSGEHLNTVFIVFQLLTILKMNELQWAEAWEHAETAVQADNHLRVWWFNQTDGLLYECETGEIKLKSPVGKST